MAITKYIHRIILWGGVSLILLVAFALRMYYLEQKVDAHVDEILSIILSEYNEYGWGKRFEENKIFSADEAKKAILWNDASIKGAFHDIYKLWKNNRDDPHTNFYYSLLRLWHIGYINVDLKQIFYRGVSLNFLFFLIGFYFAHRIARKLFQHNWMVLLFLSLAFLNPASISNTLFMRPYALQEMLFIVFCWGLLCVFERLKLNYSKYKNWRFCIAFALLTALLLSSGYFAAIFVAIVIFCASLWELIYCKPIRKITMFFPLSFIMAILFCILLYPKYFRGFRGYRGAEVKDKLNFTYLKESLLNNIESFFTILSSNLSWVILTITLVGICSFFLYRKKIYCTKYAIILFFGLSAFAWAFIVMYVAPYKTLRYIMPILPIFLLLVPYALNTIHSILRFYNINKVLRDSFIILLCIWCVYSIFPKDKTQISFINHHIFESQPIRDNKRMVVIVLQATYMYANIIPYLNTNMIFLDSCKILPDIISQYGEIEVITDQDEKCNLNSYDIVKYWEAGGFKSVLLKK